jgi:hypothetical protein
MCKLTHGKAGERHGRGMGMAWERHGPGMLCVNPPLICHDLKQKLFRRFGSGHLRMFYKHVSLKMTLLQIETPFRRNKQLLTEQIICRLVAIYSSYKCKF